MFKIGEFSKLTQVSIRMLRYYDEAGLLPPAFTDPDTGYRMYTVEQIPTLHRILFLRDTGFSVAEIGAVLAHWSPGAMAEMFHNKRQEIECAIAQEQEKLQRIAAAMTDLGTEKLKSHLNVTIKSVPAYPVLSLRRILPDYFAEGMLWKELTEIVRRHHLQVMDSSLSFAIYHDGEFKDSGVDVEICTVVDALGEGRDGAVYRYTEAVPHMACAMVYGPFENIAGGYASFAEWLSSHSLYRMTGQSRQICHRGPWNESDEAKYLTEIQIPVEKTGQ